MSMVKNNSARGLYRPEYEHDSCGVGFVANINGAASNRIVTQGIEILENLAHRGAVGANPTTGDGAGILIQIPHEFFRHKLTAQGVALPEAGAYGVGQFFLPQQVRLRHQCLECINEKIKAFGLTLIGWSDVDTDRTWINDEVRESEPVVRQVFVLPNADKSIDTEGQLYIVRRQIEREIAALGLDDDCYCVSFSSRIIVYKGMFMADQLCPYYRDLRDVRFKSAFAIVHQRFSTNTFPAWKLAHPYRMIAHNGEINTLRGNINKMLARQQSLHSDGFGGHEADILPLFADDQSDTATFDNMLEFLVRGGFSLEAAVAMMIPEAWEKNPSMSPALRDFYRYYGCVLEPWDGPADIVCTDGEKIVVTLDRNGLRPGRYWITRDDMIVMASEAGVLNIADSDITHKGRIQPGKIMMIDIAERRVVFDEEIKQALAQRCPYGRWMENFYVHIDEVPKKGRPSCDMDDEVFLFRQKLFGCTREDLQFILKPMVLAGNEPVGSMGDDTPIAVLSDKPKPLSNYFRQEFAQVTNPAIDPIRENVVMSLNSTIGDRGNLLDKGIPRRVILQLSSPVLSDDEMEKIKQLVSDEDSLFSMQVLNVNIKSSHAADTAKVEGFIETLCKKAISSVRQGTNILILSDADANGKSVPLPMLLAVSAVHQALIKVGLRYSAGIIAQTATAREVHDFATLAGFGADAIYPFLAYESCRRLPLGELDGETLSSRERCDNYRKSVGKGLLKIMSKMGISTFASYCAAQQFEAVGLDQSFVDAYFCRTISQIGGASLQHIMTDSLAWHADALATDKTLLEVGGNYAYRIDGEKHLWTPQSISALQLAVRTNNTDTYADYAAQINEQSEKLATLRGMLEFTSNQPAIDLDEVEPASELVKRFSTGAMSFGSISWEAHTTLAIAMNRIGGRSNTGEGGEEQERFIPLENGDSMRSSIKQVASGRFGVNAHYLVNSDMMQIKIAQGAKPGEGGQIPGHKVNAAIARVRFSVPGVGLISPPPHHDIYSIEDIAQLIYDLKNINKDGLVSVKLVSRHGVGTVAAGVAKARSDHITIAGHDGGTGASPLSSIRNAGTPWELGLSETHQTLLLNNLRSRISLQVDGQMKTGRDVIIGGLLGADEFGFATAPLVAEGCLMMRKCHLNTCPVGIATQDEALRKKFTGQPEHVINYFFFVAEEVRALMAKLGYRRFDDLIGQTQHLTQREIDPAHRAAGIDMAPLLYRPDVPHGRYHMQSQDHALHLALDNDLIFRAAPAITSRQNVRFTATIRNRHRTVGAMLSHEIVKRHGAAGLPEDTVRIHFSGVAGQSFGAFLARGVTLELEGEANDYVGKGLSGGILCVYPPNTERPDGDNIIAGNTLLYGAIGGECYLRGAVGERFAVRNSGALCVVEGVGDHGCEYMTGGVVVILGKTGRNFAAGMSGGIAYVFDEESTFPDMCNMDQVFLEPISHESHGVDVGESDITVVTGLLKKHVMRTGSAKAQFILENWESVQHKFVKVFPYEYARVLSYQRKEIA